ncbi:MAG: hypothetical protein ACRED5_12605 [Propylenella sp.]
MKLPDRPEIGLVLCYAYLWKEDAEAGRLESSKDRPAVVVLARRDVGPSELVYVAPVTHSPPSRPDEKVEIGHAVKRHLGLDADASWISATELNVFAWPGPDLRPIRRPLAGSSEDIPCYYGFLPRGLFNELKRAILANWAAGRVRAIKREE